MRTDFENKAGNCEVKGWRMRCVTGPQEVRDRTNLWKYLGWVDHASQLMMLI